MQPAAFPNVDPVHSTDSEPEIDHPRGDLDPRPPAELVDHIPGEPNPTPDPTQPAPGQPAPDGPAPDPNEPEQPAPDRGGGLQVQDAPDGLTQVDAPSTQMGDMLSDAG